jgi:diguanylate cyclase (GGDEF)-like protein
MAGEAGDMEARLRSELPGALRDGQVVGYFQPEVELSTGRLVAAELLARWEHPELGTLQPALFISLVEELGLMGELSRLMLRQALGQHRAWAAADFVVPISVNIGPDCVADPSFPAAVAQLLRDEQVPGQMLTLEVSEETGTSSASTRFFAQLAALDVRVSLDDFGTGFASLESLGGWPIDELKLDRSIVRPMVSSATFRTIVSTTVDLAHQLGVKVVGEGIESEAISSELRSLGCDIGQGYFHGRPMPAATFAEWMSDPARLVVRRSASGYPRVGPLPGGEPDRVRARGVAGRVASAARSTVQAVGSRTLAATAAMLAVYGLWQVFRWGGREHQALIGDLAFIPVIGAGVVLAWLVSRRGDLGPRTCRGWRLLSGALALYLLGNLLQLVYEVVLHRRPYPAWPDAAYLSFYVVAFCGLISFPPLRRSGPERWRLLLDMGTVFVGGVVLVWYLALGPDVAAAARFSLIDLVNYAYPLGDLLVLAGSVMVLWRGVPESSVAALRIIAAGMLVFVAADLIYDYLVTHSSYLGGDPVDALWIVALTMFYLAAACQLRSKPTGAIASLARPTPGRPSLLPYVAVLVSYLLLAIVAFHTVRFDPLGGILLGAVALTFMVSTRQYIALLDFGRLASRYQQMAAIDGMTGLYNRSHFMEIAEAAFAHGQQLGVPFVALMLDVDNFKQINDTHGHAVGDQVLAEFAEACREHLRPDDIVGRYGGDEFAIMVPGITSRRAIQIAEQLVRPPTGVLGRDSKPLAYTLSIGIAECPADGDLPGLLAHADLAMYEAKQAGGGGWHVFRGTGGPGQDRQRTPPASASALSELIAGLQSQPNRKFQNPKLSNPRPRQIGRIRKKSTLNVSAAFPSVFTTGGPTMPRRAAGDLRCGGRCYVRPHGPRPATPATDTDPCGQTPEACLTLAPQAAPRRAAIRAGLTLPRAAIGPGTGFATRSGSRPSIPAGELPGLGSFPMTESQLPHAR